MRTCEWCGGEFTPPPNAKTVMRFCRNTCRNHAWRGRSRVALEEEEVQSPVNWDGKTRYSDVQIPRRHVGTCSLCARTVSPSDMADWHQAVRSGRCGVCQGPLWFEYEDTGSMGSVDTSRALRISSRQSLVVPRGRVP